MNAATKNKLVMIMSVLLAAGMAGATSEAFAAGKATPSRTKLVYAQKSHANKILSPGQIATLLQRMGYFDLRDFKNEGSTYTVCAIRRKNTKNRNESLEFVRLTLSARNGSITKKKIITTPHDKFSLSSHTSTLPARQPFWMK